MLQVGGVIKRRSEAILAQNFSVKKRLTDRKHEIAGSASNAEATSSRAVCNESATTHRTIDPDMP
jgi:hypothetical protein